MVVDDEGHDADVDRADRVGWWVDVDLARPVDGEGEGDKGEALPRWEPARGWGRSDLRSVSSQCGPYLARQLTV